MMLSFILHDIEMSIPLFSAALLVSEEEVYSPILPGFHKTYRDHHCAVTKDGC